MVKLLSAKKQMKFHFATEFVDVFIERKQMKGSLSLRKRYFRLRSFYYCALNAM